MHAAFPVIAQRWGGTLVHGARVSSATVFTSNYTATRMLFNVDRNWFVSFLFVCFEDKQTEKMVPCSIYIGTRWPTKRASNKHDNDTRTKHKHKFRKVLLLSLFIFDCWYVVWPPFILWTLDHLNGLARLSKWHCSTLTATVCVNPNWQ